LAASASSCGSDSTTAVEDAVRATFAAFNDGDAEAFLDGWTDAGFEATFGLAKEEARPVFPGGVAFHRVVTFAPFTVGKFFSTTVENVTATTVVEVTEGHIKQVHRLSLVRDGGVWKIDGAVEIEPEISPEAEGVDVKMKEFKFEFPSGFETSAVAREITFRVSNIGGQPHEFGVLAVQESGTEEFLGRVGPLNPGQSATLSLTRLEAGHYAMLCNLLDTQGDGRPHSAKGMRVDFEVQ